MTQLPVGWAIAELQEVAEVRLGRQRSPERATGERMRPYLRAANVGWRGLTFDDVKEMAFTERRLPVTATVGVRPRGPQLRPTAWSERTPLSSRKKTLAPQDPAAASNTGYVVSSHVWMASGSRSYARRNGFCGVIPRRCSQRPTVVTSSVIPSFRWISVATILRVQRAL